MDTAVWLEGNKGAGGSVLLGIGHYTVEALQGIGVLDDIIGTSKGLVIYPVRRVSICG